MHAGDEADEDFDETLLDTSILTSPMTPYRGYAPKTRLFSSPYFKPTRSQSEMHFDENGIASLNSDDSDGMKQLIFMLIKLTHAPQG